MNLTKIKSALKAGNYEPIQELINANANVLPHGLYRIKNDDIQFMHREDVFDLEDLLDVLELPIDQVYWLTQNKFWILLSGETTSGFYVFHSEVAPLVNLTIRNGGDFAAKGEFDIPNTLPLQDILVEDLTDEQREEMISHLVDDGYEIDEDTSDEEILEYYAEMCEDDDDDEDDEYYDDDDDQDDGSVLAFDLGDGTFIVGAID